MKPKNKRTFIAKYLSATDYKGERCKIIDTRQKKSVTYSWDYSILRNFINSGLKNQALSVFSKLNIEIEGYSEPTDESLIYLFSSDFETTLQKVEVNN